MIALNLNKVTGLLRLLRSLAMTTPPIRHCEGAKRPKQSRKSLVSIKRKQPIFNLDAEEQELSDSIDRGEWVNVKNLEEEKAKARQVISKKRQK
jgi:hypothetical protein